VDRAAGVVEHRDHAADGEREELVRLGTCEGNMVVSEAVRKMEQYGKSGWDRVDKLLTDSVVWVADGLGAHDAGEEVVLLVAHREAGGAADDRHGRLSGDVLAEDRGALLAGEGDHSGLHRGPLVEVRLVLDHWVPVARRGGLFARELGLREAVVEERELVRINCAGRRMERKIVFVSCNSRMMLHGDEEA
jgi:hypothetical protein